MSDQAVKTARRTPESATVYFGSAMVSKPEATATLPAKLDRILKKFDLAALCQGARVPIKMHLGGPLGFTTLHPVFVRVVVNAVKAAGGKPFLVEGYYASVASAAERGYTPETVGCPIVSAGGPYDSHLVPRKVGYRSLDTINVFGAIWDAPCLINFSHIKGHGACGFGGACKNIAMGCVDSPTRTKIHALEGGIEWIKEKCTFCGRCAEACDTNAINVDPKEREVSIFFHHCRFCRHCVSACPTKALVMRAGQGYKHFQEGMAITTKTIMDSFDPERVLHINLLTNITMFCDCWGFSTPSMVPDIGVMAARDMVVQILFSSPPEGHP